MFHLGLGLAAGGLLGGIAQGIWSGHNARSAFRRESDLSERFWNMNNAYNHPVQQMKRLREAGLNPNLVYGSGSVVGNTAGMPSVPHHQVGSVPDLGGKIMDSIMQYQTLKQQDAQTGLINAQKEQALSNVWLQQHNAARADDDMMIRHTLAADQLKSSQLHRQLISAQIAALRNNDPGLFKTLRGIVNTMTNPSKVGKFLDVFQAGFDLYNNYI